MNEIIIPDTIGTKLKIDLNSTELTQDGTPTPDNPVDVNVIKGVNNIKVGNKNLLNIANYNGTINNLTVKSENQQITIDGTANSGTYTWIVITSDNFYTRNGTPSASAIVDYANGKIISTGIVSKLINIFSGTTSASLALNIYDENGATVSTPIETTKIIAVGIYLGNGQTFNNYKFGIQLEKGSTITDYVACQEQNYPINLGDLEYCKIGDYADQIFKNTTDSPYYDNTLIENEYYLKKNINKVIFNGSEIWNTNAPINNNYGFYVVDTNVAFNTTDEKKALSNYFNGDIPSNIIGSGIVGVSTRRNTGQGIFFRVPTEVATTVAEWEAWLSTHNVTVYYGLATPTYIHISETDYPTLKTELDNLYNNAKSYTGTTIITQTNEDLSFNIEYSEIKPDIKDLLSDINEFLRVNL